VPHAAKSPATVNADFATTIIIRASEIVAGAAADQGDNPNAFEALQKARDEFVAGHLHRDEKGRTYGWPQLVDDLRRYLEAHGIVAPGTWGNITRWSTATNHNQVARILRESAPQISKLVYDRTEAATAFELMTEKQRNEHLLMKKAAAFLSQQGLEVDIQWDREDPDGPLDFVGTIDGMPWGFELKALRADPEGYHRKVGHPNEQKSLEQQLESLAAPLPEIRDDAGTLQKALDKAVRDAGKPSKIDDLNGAKYCLVVHNYQFTYVDAWRTVTLPDLALFDAVIVLHQDTIAPASTWEVLCQTGIGKPLASQDIEDLADIAKFKASRTRGPDPELVRYAWALLESAESICDEIPQTFGPGG
jgi:hypothetical protein